MVKPGNEFCSCISVGTLKSDAMKTMGPLAKPPVPITKSGLKLYRIIQDFKITTTKGVKEKSKLLLRTTGLAEGELKS